MVEEITKAVTCKHCGSSEGIVKYGTYKGTPRYWCKACQKKFKADENATNNIVASIKRNGIRQTARDLNVDHSAVRYWLKSHHMPQWVIEKYAGVGK